MYTYNQQTGNAESVERSYSYNMSYIRNVNDSSFLLTSSGEKVQVLLLSFTAQKLS